MEKRRGAGCLLFPGGCPESETCHGAQQTVSAFPRFSFVLFICNSNHINRILVLDIKMTRKNKSMIVLLRTC